MAHDSSADRHDGLQPKKRRDPVVHLAYRCENEGAYHSSNFAAKRGDAVARGANFLRKTNRWKHKCSDVGPKVQGKGDGTEDVEKNVSHTSIIQHPNDRHSHEQNRQQIEADDVEVLGTYEVNEPNRDKARRNTHGLHDDGLPRHIECAHVALAILQSSSEANFVKDRGCEDARPVVCKVEEEPRPCCAHEGFFHSPRLSNKVLPHNTMLYRHLLNRLVVPERGEEHDEPWYRTHGKEEAKLELCDPLPRFLEDTEQDHGHEVGYDHADGLKEERNSHANALIF
mmetsp:Transcript_46206/g.122478  ORF Transcript_46206/g.122478 Transcript_46206/m.122478 type:complete len:284 (+) Transcript_46206:247-1098(+)